MDSKGSLNVFIPVVMACISQEIEGNHCGLGNQLLDFPAFPGKCLVVLTITERILTIPEGNCGML